MVERKIEYIPRKRFTNFNIRVCTYNPDICEDIKEELKDPSGEIRKTIKDEFKEVYKPGKYGVSIWIPSEKGAAIIDFDLKVPVLEKIKRKE